MRRLMLLGLLLCVGSTNVLAEEAKTKVHPLAPLHALEGTWTGTYEQNGPEGWVVTGTSTVKFRVRLDGSAVEKRHIVKMRGSEWPMMTTFTFDPHREVYRLAAVDGPSGLMDIHEGQLEDGFLVVDNTGSGTSMPLESGDQMSFRLRFDLRDSDALRLEVFNSIDGGANWAPMMKVSYERVAS
ncbi:MAG: DUF1579 family protein [Acidobacteriota bacterium]